MIRQFPWPDHSALCDECCTLWEYDLEDAQKYDDGSSLFYFIECPMCENIILVSPAEYMTELNNRKREILGHI